MAHGDARKGKIRTLQTVILPDILQRWET